jgi:hypothetical protein
LPQAQTKIDEVTALLAPYMNSPYPGGKRKSGETEMET